MERFGEQASANHMVRVKGPEMRNHYLELIERARQKAALPPKPKRQKKKKQRATATEISKQLRMLLITGDYHACKKLLSKLQGQEFKKLGGLEIQDFEGATVLYTAVKTGGNPMFEGPKALMAVKMLLRWGALADIVDYRGVSPLMISVQSTRAYNYFVPVVHELLQGGIVSGKVKSPGASTELKEFTHGYTALHLAARTANPKCMQLMVDFNADCNARDTKMWTALQHCMDEYKLDLYLRSKKVECNMTHHTLCTTTHHTLCTTTHHTLCTMTHHTLCTMTHHTLCTMTHHTLCTILAILIHYEAAGAAAQCCHG
jgi:hypothetical protein